MCPESQTYFVSLCGALGQRQEERQGGANGQWVGIVPITIMIITADIYREPIVCCALCSALHMEPPNEVGALI